MSAGGSSAFLKWVNSSNGPQTTHFWGPVANWGLVLAGIYDMKKPAGDISINMTGVLCVYSLLFMRFAWMVVPRNYLLLSCHVCNETVQGYQMSRALQHKWGKSAGGSAPAAATVGPLK
jgi:hypothetical protein